MKEENAGKWILRGLDYGAWKREASLAEIIKILQAFRNTREGRKSFHKDLERGTFGVSIIFPSGVGEHLIIKTREKTAIRILTS